MQPDGNELGSAGFGLSHGVDTDDDLFFLFVKINEAFLDSLEQYLVGYLDIQERRVII